MRTLTRNRRSTCKLSLQRLEDRATPAAIVTNVTINSLQTGVNQSQRSRVTDVAVTFDSPVTFVGSATAAFTLNRVSFGTGGVNLAASVNNSGPGTVVTLTFVGGLVNYDSLADGRYALHASASQFASGLDGDGNGTSGDDFVFDQAPNPAPLDTMKIFRLFGDQTGDGAVATNDFLAIVNGTAAYSFDFDNDGAVAANDFRYFRLRFGGSI